MLSKESKQLDGHKAENIMNYAMVSLNNQSVLLQTVNIVVSDELNKTFITVKAIFDSGSMKAYVSQRLLDALKLKPISKQDLF